MQNRVLKPYHLFNYEGKRCLINIEDMNAYSIDKETAIALECIATESETPLNSHIEEQLQKLRLISFGGLRTKIENIDKKEPVPIINITLFLTSLCNLKCIYCYGNRGHDGVGEKMGKKTAYQAVDWLIEKSGKVKKIYIGFFGGEPFLIFPLMKAVVEYAKKRVQKIGKKVEFNVNTNGSLLDDETISFIKEHNIQVKISFDGPKEVQDTQRPFLNGKGSYDLILPKIKKLLEISPSTNGHAVLTINAKPKQVKDALQEIGFLEISMLPASVSLFGRKLDKSGQDRFTEDLSRLMDEETQVWIGHIKRRDNESLKRLMSNSQLYAGIISFLHNLKSYYPCGAGLGFVGVSCSGDVYVCHRFIGMDDYKLGSVFQKDIDREKYLKSPITCNDTCSTCFARYYCGGGCKHDNVVSTGSVFMPSEDICRWRRRQFELAAYITCMIDNEDRAFLSEHKIIPLKPCLLDF